MPPGSPFGPGITALVVYLHTQQFVSYNRMAEMLKGVFGLDISQGAIANMLARAGKPFARQAKGIAEVVRNSAVISSDETSARVQGKTWWQWVFGSAQTFGPSGPGAVSHRIADTRGAIAVTEALAGARPEVWVSDRYSAQRGHGVLHQACLAHLLRDALGLLPPRQAATAMYAIDSGDWWFALAFKAARP